MLGTPRMTKSQNLIMPEEKQDPNIAAMESLKIKLKNFIFNHNQVVRKLKGEISILKKENEYLRQNNK